MDKLNCTTCFVHIFCTSDECAKVADIDTGNECTLTENDILELKARIRSADVGSDGVKINDVRKINSLKALGVKPDVAYRLIRGWRH